VKTDPPQPSAKAGSRSTSYDWRAIFAACSRLGSYGWQAHLGSTELVQLRWFN